MSIKTFDSLKSLLDTLQEIIAATGKRGLPSGHLYAMLMGHMDIDTYQKLIDLMVEAGGVTLKNHVLHAIP